MDRGVRNHVLGTIKKSDEAVSKKGGLSASKANLWSVLIQQRNGSKRFFDKVRVVDVSRGLRAHDTVIVTTLGQEEWVLPVLLLDQYARGAGVPKNSQDVAFFDVAASPALRRTPLVLLPPLVVEPLKKLVWGRNLDRSTLEGLVNTVKLFCTIYDPASGRYRFDYSLLMEIFAGVLALGIAAAGIVAATRNVR